MRGTSVEPLRRRACFDALRRDGRRSRHGALTVTTLPGAPGERVRVGYSIGRPVGPAVTRNRVRRRLRAIVASLDLTPGAYLIGAGPAAADASFDDLDTALRRLLADRARP
ncbi:MAG: ribonuclease P protein component [Acidimicrobiales bacterium]